MKKNIFFAILIAIVFISIGYYFKFSFSSINPTLLTLISGSIGFAVSKFYEDIKESKQRIYDQKREIYKNLISPFKDLLKNIKTKKGSQTLTDKQIATAMDAAFDNILFASDDVIKMYGKFRNNSLNVVEDSNKYYTLKLFALLLFTIRKDLGNRMSDLKEVEILRMFINMNKQEEIEYQREFDKIKIR